MTETSARHAEILNGYQAMGPWYGWAKEKLGDLKLVSWSYGRASMVWEIDDRMLMGDGVMFGGHVASVSDQVAALVTMSTLTESDGRFRTSRLETNFFRPVMKPRLVIEARATNVSATLIHAEADYFNADGKLAVRINAVQVRRRKS